MLAAIDFHALGRVIVASLIAGVGIPVLYSLAIFGVGKADETRRRGLSREAAAYSALAIAALLLFGASVVFGVSVMLNKDQVRATARVTSPGGYYHTILLTLCGLLGVSAEEDVAALRAHLSGPGTITCQPLLWQATGVKS